jgi:hypothetical protein
MTHIIFWLILIIVFYLPKTYICKGKHRYPFIDPSQKVHLEVNTEKTRHMFRFPRPNVGKNHGMKVANQSFDNVANFRHLIMEVTNQNFIHEEEDDVNACCHSV